MKYLAWLGVACVVLMTTSCASSRYGSDPSSRSYDVTDFNGDWQLVPSRSDGGRWLDDRARLGVDDSGDDDWGTRDRTADRPRYRAWFLPDEFRIDGSPDMLRIENRNGSLISEILVGDTRYGSYRDQGYYESDTHARWTSDRRFQIERTGRGGRRAIQTFMLENRGRRLIVETMLQGDVGTRTFTREYERA